jgi:UDP-N-acetylglucosamine 4,6-dehydratase (inverting)
MKIQKGRITTMLNNKSILITGGTGTFGKAFVATVIKKFPKIKKLIIFSRDELKQFEMSSQFSSKKHKFLRYYLGDVRDKERVKRAIEGVDYIIHAAALKQVNAAEKNPLEFIKTNILGAQNIIDTSLDANVKKVIALSSDKAASPINLYGATKLCSDKLFIAANSYVGSRKLSFSVIRYGNVLGSRGSVLKVFLEKKKNSMPFGITDYKMTRFNLNIKQAVESTIWALTNSLGGEIVVPKIPSFKIIDLATAIDKNRKKIIIGRGLGEKLHEELISSSDSYTTYDIGKYYLILPSQIPEQIDKFKKKYKIFKKVEEDFSYTSKNNKDYLKVEEIKKEILKYDKI